MQPVPEGVGRYRYAPTRRSAWLSIRIFLPVAFLFVSLYLFSTCAWYETAPAGSPVFGVNFSCRQADYLGLDCFALFAEVLDDLGARYVRLSAYWSGIERRPGVYDFSEIDRLLDLAHSRGALVTVTVGMKAQRYPEFWLPRWLAPQITAPVKGFPEDTPALQEALFPYLEATAAHLGAHPAVEAFQVENEPFTAPESISKGWSIRPEFLLREIDAVRAADPGGHPIVVNHGSWSRWDTRWRWIVDNADVLGQSVYTKRQHGPWPWFYLQPFRWGWFTPALPEQARTAEERGKALWITELQGEPFEHPAVDLRRTPTGAADSNSPAWLRQNVELARRSGASRVYVWGVEWWAYLRDRRDDPSLWMIGRETIGRGEPRVAGTTGDGVGSE
jgi:hypothetical protein